jgi:type IV secretion system protein VirB8
MTAEKREELDAYFREAGSWADDRSDAMQRSRKIAWIVAGVASAIAMILALTLFALTPLKTVVPYTLLVDKQTGFVQALDPVKADAIKPDTALTQSFLVQYVIAREGFDIGTVKNEYKKVALWSVNGARADYVNRMNATNPQSPLASLPRNTIIEPQIRSVTALDKNSALVRFDTVRMDQGVGPSMPQSWVAVIKYRYSNAPMSTADRFINPLGFQVTQYSKSSETAPAQAFVQPPAVTTPYVPAQRPIVDPAVTAPPATGPMMAPGQ